MKNVKNYQPKTYKSIPLAFDQSLSYYECICNITNYINNEIIPAVEETSETVIILSNKFDDLKNYVDDNMLTKDIDNLTYYTKTSDLSKVALTGDYNDLSNKPVIPDVSNYVTKDTTELENYTLTSNLSSVATTGNYNDLSNKPTIPVVPTNISSFNNDSGYITKDVNDLTNYTLTSNLSSVATSGSYNDLSNKPTIPDVSNFITKDVNNLTYYTLTSNLSSVATSGNYNDLSNKPTIPVVPTNVSAFTNDSGYITKNVNDLTNYTLTSSLSSIATSGSYNDLSNKPNIPPSMSLLSYGSSSWNDFITAYNSKSIVYCRASSNSNPATGSQTRLAFMAYVNNADTPTSVEFQYYRSVSTHSDSQQGDQLFVYTLTNSNGGTWSVTTRNSFSKVVAGTDLSSSYSNGTITLNNTLRNSLSTVATSGSYNDLSNKPSIPFNNDFAILSGNNKDITGNTAWATNYVNFSSSDTFVTSDSNLFEYNSSGNTGIKCNFDGSILLIRTVTLDASCNDAEFDLIDDYGTLLFTKGISKISITTKNVTANTTMGIPYITGKTDFTIYNARFIIIRLK